MNTFKSDSSEDTLNGKIPNTFANALLSGADVINQHDPLFAREYNFYTHPNIGFLNHDLYWRIRKSYQNSLKETMYLSSQPCRMWYGSKTKILTKCVK